MNKWKCEKCGLQDPCILLTIYAEKPNYCPFKIGATSDWIKDEEE